MGKLAIAGTTVVLGGGTAVGGVVLSKMFSFDSTLPETVNDFKGQKDEEIEGCVQHLFPGLGKVDGSGATDATSSSKVSSIFDSSKKEQSDGCLVVNWHREEYDSDSNWKGNFRFLWAVQQEDKKGFVVFATLTTTNDTDKKLLWKGVAYSLEKQENQGWTFSKKKEVSGTDKKTDKTATDNKFPKPHSDLTSEPFWGFMKNNGDMDNMCGDSGCSNNKTSTDFEGYWVWKGSSGSDVKKLGEWNLNGLSDSNKSWWEELFGKDDWDMSAVVNDMTGYWEKKVWSGI